LFDEVVPLTHVIRASCGRAETPGRSVEVAHAFIEMSPNGVQPVRLSEL